MRIGAGSGLKRRWARAGNCRWNGGGQCWEKQGRRAVRDQSTWRATSDKMRKLLWAQLKPWATRERVTSCVTCRQSVCVCTCNVGRCSVHSNDHLGIVPSLIFFSSISILLFADVSACETEIFRAASYNAFASVMSGLFPRSLNIFSFSATLSRTIRTWNSFANPRASAALALLHPEKDETQGRLSWKPSLWSPAVSVPQNPLHRGSRQTVRTGHVRIHPCVTFKNRNFIQVLNQRLFLQWRLRWIGTRPPHNITRITIQSIESSSPRSRPFSSALVSAWGCARRSLPTGMVCFLANGPAARTWWFSKSDVRACKSFPAPRPSLMISIGS